jgi:ferredoxin/flavodoxin
VQIRSVTGIYFSPTGTTQRAVDAFCRGTGQPFELVDLTLPRARKVAKHSFGKDDVVVVGLPVYGGRLPKNLDDFFSALRGQAAPAIALVVYGNRDYNDALVELRMRLEDRNFKVEAGATFIGEHTFSQKIASGRPDAQDLVVAADFGRITAASIAPGSKGELKLKGEYPFVWKGYDPAENVDFPPHPKLVTNETCTQCGICAENCPWGAIDPKDGKIRDYSKCMICYRCAKICPVKAIEAKGEKFLAYLPQFEARLNSQRREPELFLPHC